MEVIRLSGYTEDEKVEIAKTHLIPKQTKAHGLRKNEWSITEDALRDLIRFYTREAGVRNLEREIANLARKGTKEIVSEKKTEIKITRKNLQKYAGVKKYLHNESEKEDMVGITTGLAYTEVGGDILLIEAVTTYGKGKFTITGKLGEVMQESVQAALSYVRSRCLEFGIKPPVFQEKDIHIHVPEGATPKDGPSAGIAMCTTIVSVLTGIPVKKSVAMTGEISLRGRVLPIGGLKEKMLAAARAGIKTVIIPQDNVKDLEDIPDNIKKSLEIVPVNTVDEVLKVALAGPLTPVEWTPPIAQNPLASDADDSESSTTGVVVKH
jgi:ATP-dependent Lon protease